MTLTGLYVPLITPFDASGAVAVDALRTLTHQVLTDGATGIVALGTTAEPTALSAAEQQSVVDTVAEVCRERSAPLLVGANTVAALRELRERPEVTAALSVVPAFVRPGEAGVVAHFAHLAATGGIPLVVYHVPYRTGQRLSVDALRALAGLPGVVGVKYSTGAIDDDAVRLLADPPAGFSILGGDDALISPLLALGAHGGILASAHVATAGFAELLEAWRIGDPGRARPLGHHLAATSLAMFAQPNPAVIKAVLCAQGRIPTATVRLPLLPADPPTLQHALQAAAPVG